MRSYQGKPYPARIPVLTFGVLWNVSSRLKITLCKSVEEMLRLRPLWEQLCANGAYTIFQDFELNLLAAEHFAGREQPHVVCAESSNGAAIVPAVLRYQDNSARLLGEELFDYRCFLHSGDEEMLCAAMAELGRLNRPLEVVAMREQECLAITEELRKFPFACSPCVRGADVSSGQFAASHLKLARNLRRTERLGYEMRAYNGSNSE